MPFHGYERHTTPRLAEIADEGLVFEDTHVSGVGTPTSFAGSFTGAHAHGIQANISPAHWREANAGRRFLQDALQDAGYYTGAVHANPLVGRHYGWDHGWDVFRDDQWTKGADSGAAGAWHTVKKTKLMPVLQATGVAGPVIHAKNLVAGAEAYAPWEQLWPDIERFIREAPEPWFLWVLLVDTHHPWCSPPRHRKWPQPGRRAMHVYNYVMRRWPSVVGVRNETIVNAYDNELRHADAFIGRLYGLLDETGHEPALVFHSDHGDELGEHHDYGHSPAPWDTVTRVPLIMHNVGEAGRVEGPHTLLDLGSTVLDIAGTTERLSGRPSLLGEERVDRDAVYIENRELDDSVQAAIAASGWKVVMTPGDPIGFHRADDPFEQKPLDPPPDLAERLYELHYEESASGVSDSAGGDVRPEVAERLHELGYL